MIDEDKKSLVQFLLWLCSLLVD